MSKPATIDLHPGPGNRIRRTFERMNPDLIAAFEAFETPDISDQLNRLQALRGGLHNLVNDQSLCGLACTVKVFPGDNLMIHKALDIAQPGDIIVVDTAGCETTAVIGDLVAQKAKHRGIAGFVIDGWVRDLPMMQQVGLPVFARGVTPVGPLHRGPGEINYPIACGGVVVCPGDLVVADAVGVVVVPAASAPTILERLRARRESLAAYVQAVAEGRFSNAWADDVLENIGTEVRA